jgi:hypothetical protein
MSELIVRSATRPHLRWHLLATVSGLALAASACFAIQAQADNDSQPTIWIELGGQVEHVGDAQDRFTAPFFTSPQAPSPRPPEFGSPRGLAQIATRTERSPTADFDLTRPLEEQIAPSYEVGGEGSVVLRPEGGPWEFSASIRYGRASGHRRDIQSTAERTQFVYNAKYPDSLSTPNIVRFTNTKADYNESHSILDFKVGHDIGIGLFDSFGNGTVAIGVRYAQFSSKAAVNINADPSLQIYGNHVSVPSYGLDKYFFQTRFHTYALRAQSARSVHGIGPSLFWKSSIPLNKESEMGVFSIDFDLNAAVLFGRQKTQTQHGTVAYDRYQPQGVEQIAKVLQYANYTRHTRTRSLVIPNLGGSFGISARYASAKIKLGYRADFFLGAADAGIDDRHTTNYGLFGPFASISIGLGG